MKRKIRFKNRQFLRLKPQLLTDKLILFSIKNHRFFEKKARNEAVFSSCCFQKAGLYVMLT